MDHAALVVIDIQNDITRHYRDILDNLNAAIDRAAAKGMDVVYIKHNNLSPGTRTFKPDTKGAELVPELKLVSDRVFVKTKANALTSEAFADYIRENGIDEFYITGADTTGCVKSTCFNMTDLCRSSCAYDRPVFSLEGILLNKPYPPLEKRLWAYLFGKGCLVNNKH